MRGGPVCEAKPIRSGRGGGRSWELPKVVCSGRADSGALGSLVLLENAGEERPEAGRLNGDVLAPRVLPESGNGGRVTVDGRQVRGTDISSPTFSASPLSLRE